MRGRRAHATALGALVALLGWGCGDSLLTEADASNAPLLGNPTVELILRSSDMATWRDTTFQGYSIPQDAPFQIIVDQTDLEARTLARFPLIPSTFELDTLSFTVDSFVSASFRVVIDTAGSTIVPPTYTVSAFSLAESFDGVSATWTEASSGVPWTTPGGTLGTLLGSVEVTVGDTLVPADTIFVPIQVDVDSLLVGWRENGGEPGVAFLVQAGNGLGVANLGIRMRATLVETDTIVSFLRSPDPSTFIYDPPQPPVGTPLRVAALPSNRFYFDFVLPDTFDGVPIRGSTINLAELVFAPFPPPAAPFALTEPIAGQAFTLLADPFIFGPGTPVGPPLQDLTFDPDSLAAGVPIRFDVTLSILRWASAPEDSLPKLRFGVKPLPDARSIRFWQFGSAESLPFRQPRLRILLTPEARFLLP
jgi:hypothetical protein